MQLYFYSAARIAATVIFALLLTSCPTQRAHNYANTINVSGVPRTYRLHLPPGFSVNAKMPLVIVLHPLGGSGRQMQAMTGFDAIADVEGFVVVYPDGSQRMWDANPYSPIDIGRGPKDDIAFITELIQWMTVLYACDPDRIYLTGGSDGGLMTQRFAGQRTDLLAAAATVMSIVPKNWPSQITPSKPLPFLMINGTEDPLLPWAGGALMQNPFRDISYMGSEKTIRLWVNNNGADPKPIIEECADLAPDDGTTVFCETFTPASKHGAEAILYGVRGGGHTWPGSTQFSPDVIVGATSYDVNASEVIWDFFKRHRRH